MEGIAGRREANPLPRNTYEGSVGCRRWIEECRDQLADAIENTPETGSSSFHSVRCLERVCRGFGGLHVHPAGHRERMQPDSGIHRAITEWEPPAGDRSASARVVSGRCGADRGPGPPTWDRTAGLP